MMKRLLVWLLLAVVFLSGLGCATVTESTGDRTRRISQISDLQMRMLVEDWDYFWLFERNSTLTSWHPWVGI